MTSFSKPGESDRQNIGRYIYNRKCLTDEEATWIQHRDDLIVLRTGREHAWLDGIVENILKLCHCRLLAAIFRSEVDHHSSSTKLLVYNYPVANQDSTRARKPKSTNTPPCSAIRPQIHPSTKSTTPLRASRSSQTVF
jgi:hypothetical protein